MPLSMLLTQYAKAHLFNQLSAWRMSTFCNTSIQFSHAPATGIQLNYLKSMSLLHNQIHMPGLHGACKYAVAIIMTPIKKQLEAQSD